MSELINQVITLPATVDIQERMIHRKETLLRQAEAIPAILTSEEIANQAGMTARELQTAIRGVEKLAKSERDKLNTVCDAIIRAEREHCAPLKAVLTRLNTAIAEYGEAERRRMETEEKARAESIAEAERKRLEAIESARLELERAQKAIADAKAAANVLDGKIETEADLNARIEAGKALETTAMQTEYEAHLASERLQAEAEAAQRAVMVAPVPVEHKVAGVALRKELCYRVVDEAQLYRSNPHLFSRPEIKASAIKSTCFPQSPKASAAKPDTTSYPGLAVWFEMRASTRSF